VGGLEEDMIISFFIGVFYFFALFFVGEVRVEIPYGGYLEVHGLRGEWFGGGG